MADEIMPGKPVEGLDRSLSLDLKKRDKIDVNARTVELAFSSEDPVERWGENEVLSHKQGDYDFSRLNNKHPLLLGHNEYDPKTQIGVVTKAWVDGDKIGRAIVRFGRSDLASEIFQDVVDGIRELVSVGYDRTGIVESKKASDNMVTTRYRWMPTHIAIVPVPADTTVGIGRSKKRLCGNCDGTGDCPECDGMETEGDDRCGDCGGSGRCADCRGHGYIKTAKDRPSGNHRGHSKVDSEKFITDATTIAPNLSQETKMRLKTILFDANPPGGPGTGVSEPELRTKLTAELEPVIRNRIVDEQKKVGDKIGVRNGEIKALADAFVKDHGQRWAGKPGEVFVIGERIRVLQAEACAAPADHSDSEVRADFKAKVNQLISESRPPKNQEDVANLPEEVAGRCSLRNIYNAAARKRGLETTCFIPEEGAEFEAHKEIHGRAKEFPDGVASLGKGLILPMSMPFPGRRNRRGRNRMTRDALATDFASAGALVEPEFIFPIIELLRNIPALSRAGMTILSGVIGNLVLPRQDAPTTAQSVAEGAALAQYDQVLGQIKMSPHRVGTSQNYSRLALLQTTPDFEAMVLYDHMAQIGLYIDEMGVNGQGAGDQPLGILNQIGINSVSFLGSAANAYKNVVAMETAIRKANIYEEVSFITTSVGRGTLRVTPATLTGSTVVSGATNALWTENGEEEELIGRPAVDSQQVPNDYLIALVGRHLVMAQWGGLAVVLDTITRANQDEYRLSINTYIDFALRHAQAVSRSADSIAALT